MNQQIQQLEVNKKICTICHEEKPIESFVRDSHKKSGYRSFCRDCLKEKNRLYRLKNKHKLYENHKKWVEKNKKYVREYDKAHNLGFVNSNFSKKKDKKEFKIKTKEERSLYYAKYYANNRKKWNERTKKYNKEHRKERLLYVKELMKRNPNYKIACRLRSRIRFALNKNKKSYTTEKLIGCSFDFLRQYLESKFQHGMTWKNYGVDGWHIDHIIPCASFDLSLEENQRKCFHYTNLQPLWAKDNLSKGKKIIYETTIQ